MIKDDNPSLDFIKIVPSFHCTIFYLDNSVNQMLSLLVLDKTVIYLLVSFLCASTLIFDL